MPIIKRKKVNATQSRCTSSNSPKLSAMIIVGIMTADSNNRPSVITSSWSFTFDEPKAIRSPSSLFRCCVRKPNTPDTPKKILIRRNPKRKSKKYSKLVGWHSPML